MEHGTTPGSRPFGILATSPCCGGREFRMAKEKAELVKWGVRVMDDILQELNQNDE